MPSYDNIIEGYFLPHLKIENSSRLALMSKEFLQIWLYPILKANNKTLYIGETPPSEDYDFILLLRNDFDTEGGKSYSAVDTLLKSYLSNLNVPHAIYQKDDIYYINKMIPLCLVLAAIPSWGKEICGTEFSDSFKQAVHCMFNACSDTALSEWDILVDANKPKELRDYATLSYLQNFNYQYLQVRKDIVNKQIGDAQDRISDLNHQLEREYARLNVLKLEALGLKSQSDLSDFVDFIVNSEVISVQPSRYNQGKITLEFKGYLNNVDTQLYKNIKNQKNSYLDEFIRKCPKAEKLLDGIFLTQEYSLGQVSLVHIFCDKEYNSVTCPLQRGLHKDNKHLYNIHINSHSCFGEYAPMITRAKADGDYIAVCNLLLNLTCSLNLADTIVASKTLEEIYDAKDKPIIRINSTGELVTPESLFV